MRAMSRVRPGCVVRVRVPRRFPGATGVVLTVSAGWVTVALGWRERRTVRRQDVIEIVSQVGPLRGAGDWSSERLCAATVSYGPPDGDGPEGGGEPFPFAA